MKRSRFFRYIVFAFSSLLGFTLYGCSSSSLLIGKDDPISSEAQTRLQQTTLLVNDMNAPLEERALFLQAESFYRYRFNSPNRSAKSFFAEAAAAATDFPALQSLAGTFDLFDIRMRASDAAVQLWETFLSNYPRSRLRPLTLYRLGWSYRSVGVSGFPRENPNDAFDTLIQEHPTSEFVNYAIEAKKVPWKDKNSAATRSLVPGLGQIYVGETSSGFLRMGIAAIAAAAFAVPTYLAFHRHGEVSLPLVVLGLGGLIVLSYDYTSSYEDAMRGVVQWNEVQESKFNRSFKAAP